MNDDAASSTDLLEAINVALEKFDVPPIVLQVIVAYADTRVLEAQLAMCDELSVGTPEHKRA